MCDESSFFGFELLQELHNNQIAKKEDILILFVHWYLIKHGFRCVGIGDSKTYIASEKKSETLPDGWNSAPNYTLRYVNNCKLYILLGIKSEGDLLLHLLNVQNQSVSTVQFPINQTVNELHGPLDSVIPLYQSILNVIQKDFVGPVLPGKAAEVSTQTEPGNAHARDDPSGPDPLTRDPLRVRPSIHPPLSSQPWNPFADPTNVGAADLNPFGRGGGMIYDPFGPQRNPMNPGRPGLGVPGRLPPGSVPPFARFDPFGPPDVDQPRPRHDPDNDHLPPPGYNDMFM